MIKAYIIDPKQLWFEFSVARFAARWADFFLVFLIFRLIFRPLRIIVWAPYIDWYCAVFASAVLNSIALFLFGTTVWKSALGLRVEQLHGGRPTFIKAIAREFLATVLGMACGVPLLAMPVAGYWGWRVLNGKRTFWNRKLGLISVRTDFLERLNARPWGRVASWSLALLYIIEIGVVLFVAAHYGASSIILGL